MKELWKTDLLQYESTLSRGTFLKLSRAISKLSNNIIHICTYLYICVLCYEAIIRLDIHNYNRNDKLRISNRIKSNASLMI